MSVMGDAPGEPACVESRDGQRWGLSAESNGEPYSFEGWLTKSDLHFYNMSRLPMEYGGWICGPQVGCRYSNRMLLELLLFSRSVM